jgi:uncharacterized protein (UPF0335 family)
MKKLQRRNSKPTKKSAPIAQPEAVIEELPLPEPEPTGYAADDPRALIDDLGLTSEQIETIAERVRNVYNEAHRLGYEAGRARERKESDNAFTEGYNRGHGEATAEQLAIRQRENSAWARAAADGVRL